MKSRMCVLLVCLVVMVSGYKEEWEAVSMDAGAFATRHLSPVKREYKSRVKREEQEYPSQKPIKDTSKTRLHQKDREEFLNAHNLYRSAVEPKAANMRFMQWNDTLEWYAQMWARTCHFKHGNVDKKIGQQGQNLWVGTVGYKTIDAVHVWDIEKLDYHYSNKSCNPGKVCGHYTQNVWHDSDAVGCGVQYCPIMGNFQDKSYFVVCNYQGPGNWRGRWPYVNSTTSCSECPEDYPTCENNLCRMDPLCGDLKCENGGTMDTTTCLCDCGEDPDNKKGPWCGEEEEEDQSKSLGVVLSPCGLLLLAAVFAGFHYGC